MRIQGRHVLINQHTLAYVMRAHDPRRAACIANSVDWMQHVGIKDERAALKRWMDELAQEFLAETGGVMVVEEQPL